MSDLLKWTGVLKIRRVPEEWTHEDWAYWWTPRLKDPRTNRVLVPSRLSEDEKEGLTVAVGKNMLLTAGVSNVISYITSAGAGPGVMFQYLALGSGAISGVLPGDTTLATEYYRQLVGSYSNFGATGQLSTFIDSSHGNGTITNCGYFGLTATGTANSGTLMSQVMYLPSFVKSSVGFTFDYTVSLTSN